MGKRGFALSGFILLVLFWGSTFAAIKVGLDHAPPIIFGGMRTVLGGFAVTLAALVWGGRPNFRRDWRIFLLLAALNVAFFIGLQTFAIMYLPSGTAAVLIYFQPILVGFLAWLILGESLTVTKVVGLLLGFAGIAVVSSGSLTQTGAELPPAGIAFGASSALFWALGTVYFKKYEARVSSLWAVAVPFLTGGVALMVLGLATESWGDISWNGAFVASWMYSALVGTGFAWLLFLGLVRAGEASRVASYIFVVPLISVLIGAVFLDETLGFSLLVGAAFVVTGIYLVNRRSPKDKVR